MSTFKDMEKAAKQHLVVKRERAAVLAVVYNNLAGFYYRRRKPAVAIQYLMKAASLEQRVHGAPDFATYARLGAACSRSKAHADGLRYCHAAVESLRLAAGASETQTAKEAYNAYLAVAYHNLAVQLANCSQLQEAAAMMDVADQIVAHALPAKHRWARHICASVRRIRDLHVSTRFVEHSLRPRLAVHQAQQQSRQASRASLHAGSAAPAPRLNLPTDAQAAALEKPEGFQGSLILNMFSDAQAERARPGSGASSNMARSSSLPALKAKK